MKAPFALVFIDSLVYVLLISVYNAQTLNFNVLDYGAVGDGNSDDSSAFLRTWKATCLGSGNPTMEIPKGKTFLVQPIIFSGPCTSANINVLLSGSIVPPNNPKDWKVSDISKYIVFKDISGLIVSGSGLIDGRGQPWWALSCRKNPTQGCLGLKPTALVFENCEHLWVNHIYLMNSPQVHILVDGSNDVHLSFLHIKAPYDSPNTDGIHISASQGVSVHASHIGTGDDCISIGDYTHGVYITNIHCGPGHGISIGSLGSGGNEVDVSNIIVKRSFFYRSTNGVRIKTWEGGRGTVQDIHFSGLTFGKVDNPIIIDQHYGNPQIPEPASGVHINNVSYVGALGTSTTEVAINLNCSSSVPCTYITLNNITLVSASSGKDVSSACHNAHGVTQGFVTPQSCLVA